MGDHDRTVDEGAHDQGQDREPGQPSAAAATCARYLTLDVRLTQGVPPEVLARRRRSLDAGAIADHPSGADLRARPWVGRTSAEYTAASRAPKWFAGALDVRIDTGTTRRNR